MIRYEIERWSLTDSTAGLYDRALATGDASRALRFQLAEAQNWRCCYCGVSMNRWRNVPTVCTFEHVIPECAGGLQTRENGAAACKGCNNALGRPISEENQIPLTVRFCPRCGSLEVRLLRPHILRCDHCNARISTETINRLPYGNVTFGPLRRVAGELLISDRPLRIIAGILGSTAFPQRYTNTITESLALLAREPVASAKLMYGDDPVSAYEALVVDLRDRYTAKGHGGQDAPRCAVQWFRWHVP